MWPLIKIFLYFTKVLWLTSFKTFPERSFGFVFGFCYVLFFTIPTHLQIAVMYSFLNHKLRDNKSDVFCPVAEMIVSCAWAAVIIRCSNRVFGSNIIKSDSLWKSVLSEGVTELCSDGALFAFLILSISHFIIFIRRCSYRRCC